MTEVVSSTLCPGGDFDFSTVVVREPLPTVSGGGRKNHEFREWYQLRLSEGSGQAVGNTKTTGSAPMYVTPVISQQLCGVKVFDNTSIPIQQTDLPVLDSGSSLRSSVPSAVHKVDNGLVYADGRGGFYDIAFDGFPPELAPEPEQSMYGWLKQRVSSGISNSFLATSGPSDIPTPQGSAFLKSIEFNWGEDGQPEAKPRVYPAYEFFSANATPWVLLSDQPAERFKFFDSVKLYEDMSKRSFAAGLYSYEYLALSADSGLRSSPYEYHKEFGWFAAVPVHPKDVSPVYYDGSAAFRYNMLINRSEVVNLLSPSCWVYSSAQSDTQKPPVDPDGEAKLQNTPKVRRTKSQGSMWEVNERELD